MSQLGQYTLSYLKWLLPHRFSPIGCATRSLNDWDSHQNVSEHLPKPIEVVPMLSAQAACKLLAPQRNLCTQDRSRNAHLATFIIEPYNKARPCTTPRNTLPAVVQRGSAMDSRQAEGRVCKNQWARFESEIPRYVCTPCVAISDTADSRNFR